MEGYWQIIVSIAGIVVSAAAVWFTWLNTKQANQTHKLAMYDRRMKVYYTIRGILSSMKTIMDLTTEDLLELNETLTKSELLFPQRLRSQIGVVEARLFKLHEEINSQRMANEHQVDEIKNAIKEIRCLLREMEREIAPAEGLFGFKFPKKTKDAISLNKTETKK